MYINRMGVTRLVIILKNTVIKFPNFTCQWSHFLNGLLANIHESDTWKWNSGGFEKGRSHLLCPVLWTSWGGWILIMKRAETFSWDEWNKMDYFNDEHKKYFPGDDKVVNYGILEGRLVKIDYGQQDYNTTN